jgi:flagellar basal-body rod modification protein FlgD
MSVLSSINDTTDNTISTTGTTTTKSTADDLSSNFLTLLVAQLKNQDPTNPMDKYRQRY